MRLLLAEAERDARHALEATLAQWGYEVVVAPDGEAAASALQEAEPPRMVLLAGGLPRLEAAEVCRKVRERPGPYVYILAMVARGAGAEVVTLLESGADDFLYKPVDEHELKARLRAGRRIIDLQQTVQDAQAAFQYEAKHDQLTAVWNRSAIVDVLRHEIARGMRERTPVGVVVVDVDGFRSINETSGHSAGDAVLREVVRRLGGLVRPYDGVGRYGTEEFLIVLPGCDAARAAAMAERIRTCVAAGPVQLPGGPVSITASLGVTATGTAAVTPEALVGAAENAARAAAAAGGNAVQPAQAGAS